MRPKKRTRKPTKVVRHASLDHNDVVAKFDEILNELCQPPPLSGASVRKARMATFELRKMLLGS